MPPEDDTDNQQTDTETRTQKTDSSTVTLGPTAAKTIIRELGYKINDDGFIADATGQPITTLNFEHTTLEELGGFVQISGDIVPVKSKYDDIPEVAKQYM